ncbi:collagen alpha-2(I) chain-like [Aphelocoma coerulescens]|uniref:collagen alpha-2(I) chain-like n=1 Tax=Aphelocoma coerulescens TaxID=39617 RepID=UPI00360476C4
MLLAQYPDYRPVKTRGPQSSAFPHGDGNETLQSGSRADGLKPRGRDPSPEGSLQPPAEGGGRTQPHLEGRPPQPGTPNKHHRAQAPACALSTGPAGAWPRCGNTGVCRSPGSLLNKGSREATPAQNRAKGGTAPCGTALLKPAASQGPGSARSCHLAKAASLGLLTGTWGCSWGQRAPQGRDTHPEYRAGTLAGHQQDWRPRSIRRDPGPGYGRVTLPTLPLSGCAPSSESRSKAGRFLHPCVSGDLPVAAQSSSFPPGKSKLRCSVSKGGPKHKHACSRTPTKGRQGRGRQSQKREQVLCSQPAGEPSLPLSGRGKHQTCPRTVGRVQGPRHAEAPQGWHRDEGCDAPRVQGVTLAAGQRQADSCRGWGKGPALHRGWAGGRESSASPLRGLKPLPGLQSAWDSRALAPTYRAALVPKAYGGSFSPVLGHSPLRGRSPHAGCQLKGAQRLPDPQPAYRPVDTQGATELGLPPRGSLQPPAEGGGRTQPHLEGRPPQPGTPNKHHRAQAPACALSTGPAGAWPRCGNTGVCRSPGSLLNKGSREATPAQNSAKGGTTPCGTALLKPAATQGPGSARSCHLAKAASLGLLTGTWGCSWGQRAPQGRDTHPEYRAGTLAGHQQDWRPRSIRRDPGPGYGRVTLPTLPLSGCAPSSESRSKAGRFLHPCVSGDLPVAAQSSSFPPGKSKLRCSVSKGGPKHKHACSRTPTKGRQGRGRQSQKREQVLCSQPAGEPSLPLSGRGKHQTCPRTVGRVQGPRHAEAPQGWHRDEGCDAPRVQGVTLAAGQRQADSCRGWGKGPALHRGWAGGRESSASPLRCGDRGSHPPYRVVPLSGQPKEHNGKRPTTAKTSPAPREVAQRKATRGTQKVPWPCQEGPLPRGPLVPPLQLQPPSCLAVPLLSSKPLLLLLPLASPSHGFCQLTTRSGLRSSSS